MGGGWQRRTQRAEWCIGAGPRTLTDLEVVLLSEQQVGWLQIPMDDGRGTVVEEAARARPIKSIRAFPFLSFPQKCLGGGEGDQSPTASKRLGEKWVGAETTR